jgi:hypothetical protein
LSQEGWWHSVEWQQGLSRDASSLLLLWDVSFISTFTTEYFFLM